MLEGDCKLVIKALNGRGQRVFHDQTVLENCRSLCHEFLSLSLFFCFRNCNGVAHSLARWAACGLCDEVWDVAQAWLEDTLYSDFVLFVLNLPFLSKQILDPFDPTC